MDLSHNDDEWIDEWIFLEIFKFFDFILPDNFKIEKNSAKISIWKFPNQISWLSYTAHQETNHWKLINGIETEYQMNEWMDVKFACFISNF